MPVLHTHSLSKKNGICDLHAIFNSKWLQTTNCNPNNEYRLLYIRCESEAILQQRDKLV